jgi:type IV secretory pathway VirB3-like protein
MQNNYEIEIDSLAVGLTKPAMQFGVPMAAFYGNVMIYFLGWALSQNFVSDKIAITALFILLFVMTYIVMVWITFKDAHGLGIAWLNLKSFRKHINYKLWGNTDSYSP